jgi:hypothetical protein
MMKYVVPDTVGNVILIVPAVPLLPLAHMPVVTREPQLPVYISMSNPGLLLMLLTVTVHVPLLTANMVNHTLLSTTPSPQLSTGSVPAAVAPVVLLTFELPAHNEAGALQLSCALTLVLKNTISATKYNIILVTVFY